MIPFGVSLFLVVMLSNLSLRWASALSPRSEQACRTYESRAAGEMAARTIPQHPQRRNGWHHAALGQDFISVISTEGFFFLGRGKRCSLLFLEGKKTKRCVNWMLFLRRYVYMCIFFVREVSFFPKYRKLSVSHIDNDFFHHRILEMERRAYAFKRRLLP